MSTVTRDLGSVTAYASAVEGGYGGSYEQFCADMANISESSGMIPGVIGAIPIENASGDMVTFDDGAGDAHVHKLNVEVNPKQDFNGYDHPWVGGAGKNKIDDGIRLENTTHTSVTFGQTVGYGTPSVFLKAGTYTYSVIYSSGASSTGYYRTQNGGNVKLWDVGGDHATITLADDSMCSFWVYNANGITSEDIVHVQIEAGTDVTEYEPYSNICPISGYTGLTVTRTGKNIVEVPTGTYRGVTITRNNDGSYKFQGTTTNSVDIICFNYNDDLSRCPFRGNYKIAISGDMTVTGNGGVYASDLSMTRIMSYRTSGTYETSNGIGRMWLYFPKNVTVSGNAVKIMAYSADMDDEFEPYTGATYPVTFPAGAGTVYGGMLTVNSDGNGTLIVNRGYFDTTNLDGSEPWYNPSTKVFSIQCLPSSAIASTDEGNETITNETDVSRYNYNNMRSKYPCICTRDNSKLVYIAISDSITSIEDAKTWLAANPMQICYTLYSPQTYDLTAPQVKTLLGNNVMWADSGAMSVDYRANIGMYFEKRENKTRQIIAGVETTDKATKNYYAGDMMIVGDSLCIATTAISSGSTFVVGSNIIETTVAEQLLLLGNL